MSELKKVEIFTDGACSGNPGRGGWGAILRFEDKRKEISGAEPHTTNNRMELTAVIEALNLLKFPCEAVVTTDSRYVIDGITKGWAIKWKKNNWIKGDKSPALNPDLWDKLLSLTTIHTVTFKWIRGHTGHKENERCDELAVMARSAISTS